MLGGNVETSLKGMVRFQLGVYLYGAVGLGAALEPYIEPRLRMDVRYNAEQPNQPLIGLRGSVSGGVTGRIMAGIDLLGIRRQGDILKGEIVPSRELGVWVDRCWRGVQLAPCY
jgi:hypothetical protein